MQDKFHLTKEQNLFLAKKTLALNIYNSARLEGINTTYPDTQTILEGVNVPTLKLDEINCILNLRDAWNYTLTNIDAEVNLDFICKVNSFVSRNESLEWGVLRNGKVGINGVDYIPEIPNEKDIINNIENILKEKSTTLKSINLMLYLMRSQVFWDGNKRTSTICANKIMIENGCGIIKVPDNKLKDFTILLSEFYSTNNKEKIKQFIFDNCIDGIVFKNI